MTDATAGLYTEKEGGYFRAARFDLLRLLPQREGLRLLELGAGDGATLRAAKEKGLAAYTVGIELVEPVGGAPGVDLFLPGNFESMEPDLPAASFDTVICADVLEHLVDPWKTVSRLASLLRPGGVFLSSIPNVRNYRLLRPLVLKGDFRYQQAGLMDRSHLRFFCRRNIREMFEGAGLTVDAMEENMGGYGLKHRLADRLSFGLLHDFFVFQYLTRARKP